LVDDDYELVSKNEVNKLKEQIKALKEGNGSGSTNLILSKVNQMLDIFKEASLNLKNQKPGDSQGINEKLDKILEQNQRIAEGLLAVADLINEEKPELIKPPVQKTVVPSPILNEPPITGIDSQSQGATIPNPNNINNQALNIPNQRLQVPPPNMIPPMPSKGMPPPINPQGMMPPNQNQGMSMPPPMPAKPKKKGFFSK
jgi:hypothetical protein